MPTKKPKTQQKNNALYFFLYLVSFFSLGFLSGGIIAIVFQIINKFIQDDEIYSYRANFQQEAVQFGIASILVAAPIFYLLTKKINKDLYSGELLKNSRIRKWLTYIVLFITAAIIIGDLVSLIYNYFDGELASRSMLKIFTILAVTGTIFGYYLWDIKKTKIKKTNCPGNKIFAYSTLSIVIICLITGFLIIDTPKETREKKYDQKSINQLQSLNSKVTSYYNKNKTLPDTINDLEPRTSDLTDYEKRSISYQIIGDKKYELCAQFKRNNKEEDENDRSYYYDIDWLHEKGDYCFDKEITEKNNSIYYNK